MKTKENGRLKMSEKVSYGIGSCGQGIINSVIAMFITSYYTDTAGIAVAAVGTMMLVSRVFDGISDIAFGGIVEKTRTRWGKARPWILWIIPFVVISCWMVMSVPLGWSDGAKLVYAYASYIFLNVFIVTAYTIAHNSLLARITLNQKDRMSAVVIGGVLQTIIVIVGMVLVQFMTSVTSWSVTALMLGILIGVMLLIEFLGTKEHVGENEFGESKIEPVPLKESIHAVLKNKYFIIIALMQFFALLINTISSTAQVYYCKYVLGQPGMITMLSAAASVLGMFGMFFMPAISNKWNKKVLLTVGAILMTVGYLLTGAMGTNVLILMIGCALRGVGIAWLMQGIAAFSADVIDYGEWKTGIRTEGLINSAGSVGVKLGVGLGGAIVTWILAAGGYIGTATVQSTSAIFAIKFSFGYLGAIFSAILIVICLLMDVEKYNKEIHEAIEK